MEEKLIFEGPLKGKEKLLEFIPQRNPIVMMDELVFWDDKKTTSAFTLDQNNILIDGNYLLILQGKYLVILIYALLLAKNQKKILKNLM